MLNFTRSERPAPKEPDSKPVARPAVLPASAPPAPASTASASPRPTTPPAQDEGPLHADGAGRRLAVGPGINLKGVEISNCDVLVIEGNVDATVHSKAMEILAPGRLNGNATIDVAEIHGQFEGELTARTRLVVHGTGRVTGTIRYGSLVVAEGGSLTGDLTKLEPAAPALAAPAPTPAVAMPGSRSLLGPQP
jgi:cytoskeletal protein CcmA (bactofilin family)